MKCTVCKNGKTHPGTTTVSIQRGETLVVSKGVPAEICDNCHEYYLSEDVAGRLYRRADEAVRNGAEVEILRFAA